MGNRLTLNQKNEGSNPSLTAIKEDLVEARFLLKLMTNFCEDAHKLDYNEDRTNSWRAYMIDRCRKFIERVG